MSEHTDGAKRAQIHGAVHGALAKLGHLVTITKDDRGANRFFVTFDDGTAVGITASMNYSYSSWSVVLDGDYRSHPSRKTWAKEPKAGFDVKAIALWIVRFANERRKFKEGEQRQNVTLDRAVELCRIHGLPARGPLHVGAERGEIHLEINAPATDEQIAAMVAAARTCGLIGPPIEEEKA